MECPHCKFVAAPGEEAVDGTCPNCQRPYRSQPTPTNSDMQMRNMPAPGEEDAGGNPLQEGILGDYQNRGVRDQSFASTKESIQVPDYPPVSESSEVQQAEQDHSANMICPQCDQFLNKHLNFETGMEDSKCNTCGWHDTKPMPGHAADPLAQHYKLSPTVEHPLGPQTGSKQDPDIEIPAEVVDILPPDPESIRPDKKRMDKQADFLDDALDVAAPVAGGTAGFLVGGPAGAAVGAGLAGGGMEALQGGDVGDIAGAGLTDAALGGLGGIGAGALAAGTGAQAAAAGTTRGGLGSIMRSALQKVPTDKIRNAYLMHSVLNDAQGAGQQMMPQAPAAPMASPAPVQAPSYYSKTATPSSTPSSQDHIPSNDTNDPEQVDFHEKNDQSNDDPLSMIDVNGIGGTDTGPDGLFSPDSAALKGFADLLPKILQFAIGDQSAEGDPDIANLHSLIEGEQPGYLDDADDEHGSRLMVMLLNGKPDGDGDDLLKDNDEPHDPIAEHEASALAPGLETSCPRCGSVTDASVGHCPQCGLGNAGHQPQPTNPDFESPQQMVVANSQGPNTDEQKAVVAELLAQEGRAEEIPNMILNPFEYANELAQITGGEQPPEAIGQPGPPPPIDPTQQQGEMPVPPMASPAGAPGPSMAMAHAIAKYGGTVDGICEKCPNCGSHSTGYTDYEEGDAGCKTCGHHWKAKPLIEHSSADVHVFNEGEGSEDMEEADPVTDSLSWTDDQGRPLQVGQSYEMYSANYEIPDRIQINKVKPDVIEYTMLGDYGLNHQTELTHEEANMEQISFVPTGGEGEPEAEEVPQEMDMEDIARPAPGEETDASIPHMMMSNRTADFDDINVPSHSEDYGAGGNRCPMCKSPNLLVASDNVHTTCPDCGWEGELFNPLNSGTDSLENAFQAPTVDHPLGPHTGVTSTHDQAMEELDDPDAVKRFFEELDGPNEPMSVEGSTSEETGPEWLLDGVPRTAGAQMTPWEQRGFIDEEGVARNADKLDLGGTHYEFDDIGDSFLFGL